ncbi:hypothetical protein MNEG_9368 [Monoraphidium neglectum]|uniref:Uncharacterized protein n=1 Tax=Monoraphidium neglectum TaxID=145388 RepID=A0A0D2MWD8_9CHLO|nr:hypothetical protein MNEG_9368 [Monoraphidium neglectum]KIY98595.1 hypothetical protein MNEG_9368 [Monoraphidium neglectum]|eukprot:XP_013897615.1 hypothetical protein MNEG_9368 [Monoraphidium neglectum]
MTEERSSAIDWAAELPWIALGYNCTPQQATRLSPYQVLCARAPTVPPAVRERLREPLDFDCTTDQARDALAGQLLERAALAKRYSIMAGENLRIPQHRDTLRYAQGLTGADLEDAAGAGTERASRAAKPVAPSHKQADADLEARALHGRLVTKVFHVPGSKKKRQRPFWGASALRRPHIPPELLPGDVGGQ